MIDELEPIQKGIMALKEEVFSSAENITKGGKTNIYFQNQVYFDTHLTSYY